jgi:signal transduction histidine kinase
VAVQVGKFALAGLVAVALVGVGTLVASRRLGEREAIVDARATTVVKAQGVVEPALTDGVLRGDAAALARVASVVESDVLDRSLVRIKLWATSGRIVFSDEARLIGATYELGPEERDAIRTGRIEAEVGDLSKPENRFERPYGKLLEVYLPIEAPGGEPLLFEAYYRYDSVEASANRLWRSFAPIALGALLMLQLVQLPLAWSLASRLRARLQEREGLLQEALHASERERRPIAGDLHDGVVQDLAGVGYALAAGARAEGDPAERTRLLETSAEQVRESIKALRSLLVEIYPPNIEEEGLTSALSDLLERASGRGVTAELDATGLERDLPPAVAGLFYRATQEAVRNTLNHAGATTLRVTLTSTVETAALEVDDNGRGFDPEVPAEAGHIGLKGLAGLISDAGGVMRVRSAPGAGTTVRVEVPVT